MPGDYPGHVYADGTASDRAAPMSWQIQLFFFARIASI